jgi:hypothetical protein
MQTTARRRPITMAMLTFVLSAIGCSSNDDRLVDLSQKSAERQAEQNRLVETNDRQVIEATNRLVEAEAKSRTEILALHQRIEAERTGINQQRDALEQERRQIAAERNAAPIIAESIQLAASLITAVLPLLACLFLLRGLFDKPDQNALAELLVEDLVSRQSLLGISGMVNLTEVTGKPRLRADAPSHDRSK